jgi:hypothetical protein
MEKKWYDIKTKYLKDKNVFEVKSYAYMVCPYCGSHRPIVHNKKYCDCDKNCRKYPFENPTRCIDCEKWYPEEFLITEDEYKNLKRTKLIDKMLNGKEMV